MIKVKTGKSRHDVGAVMAIVLLELQEAGLVGITPIEGLTTLSWLGIYPTWQSIGAQLVFLIPSLGLLAWSYMRKTLPTKTETII